MPGALDDFLSQFPEADRAEYQRIITDMFPGGIPVYSTYDSSGNATSQMVDWAQKFLTDELDAQKEGDWFGNTLEGFKMPANVGVGDWMATLKVAEQWSALTGFRWFPTGQMLLDAYNQNLFTDPQKAAQYWYGKMPKDQQAKFPNAPLMMDNQTYQQSYQGMVDTLERLTGSRNPSLGPNIQDALKGNWSSSRYEKTVRDQLSKQSKYGYLNSKYGNFDYNSWQAHKLQYKQDVQRRYGNTSDQGYLTALDNPLSQFQASGGQINQVQPGKGTLTDYAASTVR